MSPSRPESQFLHWSLASDSVLSLMELVQVCNVTALLLAASQFVSAGQATLGLQQTVCGKVERVTCAPNAAHVTTLELEPKSPDLPVTILQASRGQFVPPPEELYRDTEVCATGRVETHGGQRRLVVSGPQDIAIRNQLRPPETQWKTPYFIQCDEGIKMPAIAHSVKPNYPRRALEAKIQGLVALEAIVNADGVIGEIRIRQSLDSELGLDAEAIRTVRQWRFTPGTRFDQPVPTLVEIEMWFSLTSK